METDYFAIGPWRRALVLGGARSGKSVFAERLACSAGADRWYVATAEALDHEMREKISRHREQRGPGWETVEAPRGLSATLRRLDQPERVILVDCLTLWLSNEMLAPDGEAPDGVVLAETLGGMAARVVMVSNEVGLGLVPDTPLGRRFRDAQGRLNQRVAAACDAVAFVAAGLPLWLRRPA